MANAKISDNSVFIPKDDILEVVGLAGYDASGNVKISGNSLKNSVLTGAIRTITTTSPLERTDGNFTTISIKKASKTQDGYLSSSDFTSFSNAEGAVREVGGTGKVSGITLSGNVTDTGNLVLGGALEIDSESITNGLGFIPYNAANPDKFTNNTGTITSLVFSSPLTGGTILTSGTVGITVASAISNGYLTKENWNTFNNKSTFDGDYENLINKPTIPTNTNELTNGNGFITANTSDILTNKTGSNLQWTNDAGYITTAGDNNFVTAAAYSSGTLTLTRNGSLANVTSSGFLQVGSTSSDALAGDTKTITTEQSDEIKANTLKVGITTTQVDEIKANTLKISDTGLPAILSNGNVPSLNENITEKEIRDLIGAGTGDVTADSITNFTNKTGSNLQWKNDAGYLTSAGDNTFVTSAVLAGNKLTLTRNDSVTIDATGFVQVGSTSSDALAGDTTTITTEQANEIDKNTLKVGYTEALVEANTAVSANTLKVSNVQSDWESTSGLSEILNKPKIPGDAPVDSVNTQTGAVVLTTGNISEGSNLYYTEARVNSNSNVAANTLKQTFPGFGLTSTTALKGDTVIPPAAPVDSVNGQTGAVSLTTITPAQATAISANTLKKSMVLGTEAGTALAGNTPIFDGDYENLSNLPTTITSNQAAEISANTLKKSMVIGTKEGTALSGDTVIPTVPGREAYTGEVLLLGPKDQLFQFVIQQGFIMEVNEGPGR